VVWRDVVYLCIMCILCTSTPAELNSKTDLHVFPCNNNNVNFPFLPNLEKLTINCCPRIVIPSLPRLETLEIWRSKIRSLPEFPNLRLLSINGCSLNKISPQPSLLILSISDCYNLSSLPVLPSLSSLTLGGTSISKIPEQMFEAELYIKKCSLLYVPVKVRGKHIESSLLGKRIINKFRRRFCKKFLMSNSPICEDVIMKMIIPFLLV